MAAPEWAGHEANAELVARRRTTTPKPEPAEPPAIRLVAPVRQTTDGVDREAVLSLDDNHAVVGLQI